MIDELIERVEKGEEVALLDAIAEAIDKAEVGYSLRLTRLVDEVSTYTLTYSDGSEPLEFDDISDGYSHIRARLHRERAIAALRALRAHKEQHDASR